MKNFRLCIFLVLCLLFSEHASALQCGDARVTKVGKPVFPWEFGRLAGTSVVLPTVSLARAGTTEFNVSSLPAGDYNYILQLAGGPLYNRRKGHSIPMMGPLRLTNVNVSIADPNGKRLFQHEHSLGEINVGHTNGVTISNGFFPLPYKDNPLAHALNYHIWITISQPSTAPDATARIIGFACKQNKP